MAQKTQREIELEQEVVRLTKKVDHLQDKVGTILFRADELLGYELDTSEWDD